MSVATAMLAEAAPAIALSSTPKANIFSSSPTANSDRGSDLASDRHREQQVTYTTALSCRISRSSSQQNLESDSGKSSCSPALLDCSFDSGIGVGAVGGIGGGLGEGAANAAAPTATVVSADIEEVSSEGGAFGIGTGISCNAEEHMRQQLLHERLQHWRYMLLTLDRQRDVYQQLRERLSKISERRIFRKGPLKDQLCNVCSCQIDLNDAKSFVVCCTCDKRICRDANCSDWLPQSGQRECQLCRRSNGTLTHTQSWVAEQLSFNRQKHGLPTRARSEIFIPIGDCNDNSIHFESVSQVGGSSAVITAEQKLKIREYVEEVVAKLLGGSLDQIRVIQLSKSENYIQLFEKYHSKLSNIFINLENELTIKALNGDLPGLVNGHARLPSDTHSQTLTLNTCNQSSNNSNLNMPSDFAAISQARLRQMIEAIIAETWRVPALSNGSVSEIALNTPTKSNGSAARYPLVNENVRRRHRTEQYFEPKIYQDLLATAVLNKIADNEGNIRQFSESTPDLSTRNIDSNSNVEAQSISSGSSVEPRSDFSYTDTEQSPKVNKVICREPALSDYIAAHMVPLPDLSATVTESEEDDHASVSSSTFAEGTWEDNWLFRKKRSSLTASITGSVGMLVPAPKEDIRAQIGDKTTDEISDLSEMGSDSDDSSMKVVHANLDPLNNRILNKHLIGGQNTKVVLDELIETASMVSNTSNAPNEPKYTETKNEDVVMVTSKTEAINPNITDLSVEKVETGLLSPPVDFKDVIMPETVCNQNPLSDQLSSDSNRTDESMPTTIESFPVDFRNEQHIFENCESFHITVPRTNTSNNNILANTTKLTNGPYINLKLNINHDQHILSNNSSHPHDINGDDDDVVVLRHFVPGSIAEREYKKWNNAVEMPNNPYAPEALKRRISGSQERFMDLPNISPSTETNPITLINTQKPEADVEEESRDIDYRRYSRDYYINDDKVPKTSPKRQIATTDSKRLNTNVSDEPTADIDINEQTIVIRHEASTTTAATGCAKVEGTSSSSPKAKLGNVRPTELPLERSVNGSGSVTTRSPITPIRGSTPMAFKFLQPKRKLIEPGQVLSMDESVGTQPMSPSGEKAVVEEEVVQIMPSVRALAKAFLFTSNKCSQAEKRWKGGVKAVPPVPAKPSIKQESVKRIETSALVAEIAEDATIVSDLSSLETDPPATQKDQLSIDAKPSTKAPSALSPIPPSPARSPSPDPAAHAECSKSNTNAMRRVSMLKSNIAFFENLKFK